jgi:hypothetical protein
VFIGARYKHVRIQDESWSPPFQLGSDLFRIENYAGVHVEIDRIIGTVRLLFCLYSDKHPRIV